MLNLSGRTRGFAQTRFSRSPGYPVQEPFEQSGFFYFSRGDLIILAAFA